MNIPRRNALKAAALAAAGAAVGLPARVIGSAPAARPASPDAVRLVIEFGGLCMFAAERKAVLPQLGTVYALLINTSNLTSGTYDEHHPMLVVPEGATLTHDAPDKIVDGQLQFGLHRHELTLLIDGAPLTGPVLAEANVSRPDKTQALKASPPYDGVSWSDIAFIADLDGILGAGAPPVSAAYLQGPIDASSRLATRFVLTGGRLLGGTPNDPWGRHVAWKFTESAKSNYFQALTDIVEFHAPAAQSVQLVLTRLSDGKVRRIAFKPSAAGDLRVKVQNLVHDEAHAKHCAKSPTPDCPPHHFRAYYELLAQGNLPQYPTPGQAMLSGTSDVQVTKVDPPVYCVPPVAYY